MLLNKGPFSIIPILLYLFHPSKQIMKTHIFTKRKKENRKETSSHLFLKWNFPYRKCLIV